MAYDPREVYKRLMAQVGAVPGERQFSYDPSGRQWVNPDANDPADIYRKMGTGWDTSAVYKTDEGADRYAEGQVPPWMQQQLEGVKSLYGAGGLSAEEVAGMYAHLVGGGGIDPVWAAGRSARPAWLDAYLQKWFADNLGYSTTASVE